MAHTHPGNEGDYLKHVVLEEVLAQVSLAPGVRQIRYIDPYCGEGIFIRPGTLHRPTGPSAKAQVWANQQANPKYYLGSPLIALQVFQRSSLNCSLRFSDSDFKAVAVLSLALQGGIPQYAPGPVPKDIVIQVTTYNGTDLGLLLTPQRSAINVVLLDPTHSGSYITTINKSVEACQENGCSVILMCWGLQSWNWPSSFSGLRNRERAEYSRGRYPSAVELLWFGPLSNQLASATRASLQGW